jgi:hypothetical protein
MDKFTIFLENLKQYDSHLISSISKKYYTFLEGEASDKAVDRAENTMNSEVPFNDAEMAIEEPIGVGTEGDIPPTDDVESTYDNELDAETINEPNDIEADVPMEDEEPIDDSIYEAEVLREMGKDNLATQVEETIQRQKEIDEGYVPMIISRVKGYLANPNLMSEHALSHYLQSKLSSK